MSEQESAAHQVARRAADIMFAGDRASQSLGIALVDIAPGRATLSMVVTDRMVNGHNITHGGFIFTLADSAFAFACNTTGITTVAAHASITFVRPSKLNDRLVAHAAERSTAGRSGVYDVTVMVGDETIAEFRGHSRTIGPAFVALVD